MKADVIARWRLANQSLAGTSFTSGLDVVHALGAVQAQEYPYAKWALAQRTTGARDEDIERELTEGALIRTHVLRPTWHFVAPADIRWMLALTAPRIKSSMAAYHRQLELTDTTCRRAFAAIARALSGGRSQTRAELRAILARARIGTVTPNRMGHLMLRAEIDGVVCSGPRRKNQFTYALLDERVSSAALIDRDEALLELTRRYFATRGPATIHDYAWWSGLSMADAKRGVDIAGPLLSKRSITDRAHWFVETASRPRVPMTAHLLPPYDEYFIGLKDRSAIGQRLRSVQAVTGGNALTAGVVVVDGQLVGGWSRSLGPDKVLVRLTLLAPLDRAEKKRVAAAAEDFGRFLGLRAEVPALRQG